MGGSDGVNARGPLALLRCTSASGVLLEEMRPDLKVSVGD